MSYKTILVHVEESPQLDHRLKLAAGIASAENAHLVGVAVTGISRLLQMSGGSGSATMASTTGQPPRTLALLLAHFEQLAQRAGVASFEKRLIDDEAAAGLSAQGPCCDLMILGRSPSADLPAAATGDLLQYVVLNCGCPVLIAAGAAPFQIPGRRALVAWNGSVHAARAIRSALPLLKRAQAVDLAVVSPESKPLAYGAEPGADMALYLARHGITAAIVRDDTAGADAGHALLELAASRSADWLVMGCVAHRRYPGVLLGGATGVVLNEAGIPVLMSH